MKLREELTDDAVLRELGERIMRWRLERNLSQEGLGEEAGVGRRTLQRLERGEAVQLPSLVRVLRTLGLMDALDQLVPEPIPSPIDRLNRAGRERRRARRRTGVATDSDEPWRWADDTDMPRGEQE